MEAETNSAIEHHKKPTLAHFSIEDLSPTDWQAEHERMRAALGDEAYLTLRRSELKEKMDSIIELINAGQWQLPPVTGSQQPDRIGVANREFRVGVSQGVPEEVTEAMFAMLDDLHEDYEIPEEWLEFEVSEEELDREERQTYMDWVQREEEQRLKVLNGKLSVRDIGIECLLPEKQEAGMGETRE
ncbi:unnamed protein product [Aureobasidium vineae]|uniref:Uncharacterized protein n=1 Tax=Aureobasidium vineae TaxID=2773715 RepID=A0A9N8PJS2_9PEZI|nr:unnamed protein product [Aureobasidium vineae]